MLLCFERIGLYLEHAEVLLVDLCRNYCQAVSQIPGVYVMLTMQEVQVRGVDLRLLTIEPVTSRSALEQVVQARPIEINGINDSVYRHMKRRAIDYLEPLYAYMNYKANGYHWSEI